MLYNQINPCRMSNINFFTFHTSYIFRYIPMQGCILLYIICACTVYYRILFVPALYLTVYYLCLHCIKYMTVYYLCLCLHCTVYYLCILHCILTYISCAGLYFTVILLLQGCILLYILIAGLYITVYYYCRAVYYSTVYYC